MSIKNIFPRLNLRRVNNILLTCIIVVNGYIITAPLFPVVSFWWSNHVGHTAQKLSTNLHTPVAPSPTSTPHNTIAVPHDNRLVVPSMQLDTTIYEGATIHTLNKGLWHRPGTSTPDKGGNTVIAGHRFTWTEPKGIFYYLNKVQTGDTIGVWWNGTRYIYQVSAVRVVEPTEVNIENNTSDAQLTLYTCTPLWSPHKRLVVIAKLESHS